jgi:hypothetical protein
MRCVICVFSHKLLIDVTICLVRPLYTETLYSQTFYPLLHSNSVFIHTKSFDVKKDMHILYTHWAFVLRMI